MSSITNNFSYFVNPDTGQALYNGFLYFGTRNTDARIIANQIPVTVLQEDGKLIRIPQPVQTNGSGIAVFLGSPIAINLSESEYSVYIENGLGELIYSVLRSRVGLPSPLNDPGKYLTNDGTNIEWGDALPDQTTEAGNFITTNGTVASWGEALPPQAGQENKSLSTDGNNDSWQNLIPDQTDNEDKVLSTNGTSTVWRYLYFRPLLLSDSDLDHTFSAVEAPADGKVFVTVYGLATYSHTSGSGTVTMSASTSGSAISNIAVFDVGAGSPPFLMTLMMTKKIILDETPGSTRNITTTLEFDIPAGITGTFEDINHLSVITGQ